MKTVHTAPIELVSAKPNGPFATEPFEGGWAAEALFFIYVREVHGPRPTLTVRAQVSADGVRWIDRGPVVTLDQPGAICIELERFGNWLRIAGEVTGAPDDGTPGFIVDLYWVLKG